jgi:acyl-coenzyme A thioesterase PaaI-like protein
MKPLQQDLKPFPHSAQSRCFGCGPANPSGMHLQFLIAPDDTIVCPVTIPDTFEGRSGYLHGGIIATLLDETMSKAVRAKGILAVTRHLEVDYRLPVPSRTPLRLEGHLVRSEGRKHWVEARVLEDGGMALAHGKAVFIEVSGGHL